MNYHTVKVILTPQQLSEVDNAIKRKRNLQLEISKEQVQNSKNDLESLENSTSIPLTSRQLMEFNDSKSLGLESKIALHVGQVSELARINFNSGFEVCYNAFLNNKKIRRN